MAARGHVQDPNDRRLRPIYGTDLVGTCTCLRVCWFAERGCGLSRCMCLGQRRVVESEGQRCGPSSSNRGFCCPQRPMTVHLTRSAAEPEVGHDYGGWCPGETACLRVKPVDIPGGVCVLRFVRRVPPPAHGRCLTASLAC